MEETVKPLNCCKGCQQFGILCEFPSSPCYGYYCGSEPGTGKSVWNEYKENKAD